MTSLSNNWIVVRISVPIIILTLVIASVYMWNLSPYYSLVTAVLTAVLTAYILWCYLWNPDTCGVDGADV